MLRAALAYPLAGEGRGRRLLGSLVLVASLLLLVTVPIYVGYLVRLARDVAFGDETPPSNADVGGLFVQGLSALGLMTAYAALPLAPFVVASLPFVDLALGTAGRAALVVVVVGLAYLLPAVVVSYAVQGNVVGGLAFRRIGRALASPGYLVAWLPGVVVLAASLGAGALLGATGLGIVLAPPVVLYGTLVAGHLFARGFAGQVDLPRRPVVRQRPG
jgi:hypothetical protein